MSKFEWKKMQRKQCWENGFKYSENELILTKKRFKSNQVCFNLLKDLGFVLCCKEVKHCFI